MNFWKGRKARLQRWKHESRLVLLSLLCATLIGFSFVENASSNECISLHQQLEQRIAEAGQQIKKGQMSVCAMLKTMHSLVQQAAENLRVCPEADPTGEQLPAYEDWMKQMTQTLASHC